MFRGVKRMTTAQVGRRGERVASRVMRRRGYRVLCRNQRLPFGEIDLVCLAPDAREIVFVEVKALRYRSGGERRYRPEDHVDARKRRRLRGLARAWLGRRGWSGRPWRIDVVAVEFEAGRRRPVVRHHVGAVRGQR